MDRIIMILELLAFFTMGLVAALTVANAAMLVAGLMHQDRLVKKTQMALANVLWVFRLGGGSARYDDRRHHVSGGA
jgi:hypothetical protein